MKSRLIHLIRSKIYNGDAIVISASSIKTLLILLVSMGTSAHCFFTLLHQFNFVSPAFYLPLKHDLAMLFGTLEIKIYLALLNNRHQRSTSYKAICLFCIAKIAAPEAIEKLLMIQGFYLNRSSANFYSAATLACDYVLILSKGILM